MHVACMATFTFTRSSLVYVALNVHKHACFWPPFGTFSGLLHACYMCACAMYKVVLAERG